MKQITKKMETATSSETKVTFQMKVAAFSETKVTFQMKKAAFSESLVTTYQTARFYAHYLNFQCHENLKYYELPTGPHPASIITFAKERKPASPTQ
jgi:hypothetical protein